VGGDGVLEIEGTVIGAEGYAKGGMTHGCARIQARDRPLGNRKFRANTEIPGRLPSRSTLALGSCSKARDPIPNLLDLTQ
jgi:hypothetical protein